MVYMVDLMGILSRLETLFTSRRLFSNWLLAGIMYYLIERGFIKGDIVVKCGGKKYKLDPKIYSFIVSYYHDGFLKNVSCDGSLTGRLGGLLTLVINNKGLVLLKTPDGILLVTRAFDPIVLVETYLYDIHFLGFDLNGWLIVDVGAYIGDTPLYYAKRGAFVVAVEPLPSNYEVMLWNLELNPDLKHRVIPVNAAISGRDGFVEFSYSTSMDGTASIYGGGRFKVRVRSMRLSMLIKEVTDMGLDLDRFKVRVLKMDCKGCEYDVINEVDVLRLFNIVKIEYSGHLRNRTYHELKSVLENLGFMCRVWAHEPEAIRLGLDKGGTLTCVKSLNRLLI
jgi:FkbM family methyltransferase